MHYNHLIINEILISIRWAGDVGIYWTGGKILLYFKVL